MDYRPLGTAGVKVSPLCLGAMTFGEPAPGSMMHGISCDEPTAFSIMDRALSAGVNFLDVADVYGNDGLSERVVGRWMAQAKTRDQMVIATKFRFRMGDGPNGTGASRARIVRCVDDSLRRLATDRIDLYQIHMQDLEVAEEETLRALDDLQRAGKVLYIGCSNYAAYRLVDSLWISRTKNLAAYCTMQMQYNLVERGIEREHLPIVRQWGVGILAWSPLGGGFLSGKYAREAAPPAGTRLDKVRQRLASHDDRSWRILDAVHAVAKERGATASQVALGWLIARREVVSVIFGARSLAQLDDNLKAADLKLGEGDLRRLDEASAFDPGYPYSFMAQIQKRW